MAGDDDSENLEQIDRMVEDSRQFLAEAKQGRGQHWPAEIAAELAEANETFAAELTHFWMSVQGFDSPDIIAEGDDLGLPFALDRVVLQAIEWSQNNAEAFTLRARAAGGC